MPPGIDLVVLAILAAAFGILYLPAWWELSSTIWASDEQGHGPIILAVSLWLIFRKRRQLAELEASPALVSGWAVLIVSLAVYAFGRAHDILMFTVGSQIGVLAALLLLFKGWAGLRLLWFPLFFMFFMVPLPGALVAGVTGPLKAAVSVVATSLLHTLGYPVGRTGVVMTVGPYQLLVADACAGLNSMFTLEALGMLYMNLMAYTNPVRNITLALLLVPTAFAANIVRVIILVLVTYHFGDAAGQGFVHGFAGMVLFIVALLLMLGLDKLLGLFMKPNRDA
ncbi:MAG: exosortase B [Rubrivivax sp.]|nr:MAG: exosortase B [Rubrivivax sp.]